MAKIVPVTSKPILNSVDSSTFVLCTSSDENGKQVVHRLSASKIVAEAVNQAAQDAQAVLDGIKAADIVAIKSNLITDHSIYDGLLDSSGNDILDSGENKLLGRTIFADVSDIQALKKGISDLESIVNSLLSLLIPSRLSSAEITIDNIISHALFDDAF